MIASTEQYRDALVQLRDSGRLRRTRYKEMLKAQYAMPNHAITPPQMAQAVGNQDMKRATLRYGAMAFELAVVLGLELPVQKGGDFMWFWTLSIGSEDSEASVDDQYEMVMRPELAEALESLGWV